MLSTLSLQSSEQLQRQAPIIPDLSEKKNRQSEQPHLHHLSYSSIDPPHHPHHPHSLPRPHNLSSPLFKRQPHLPPATMSMAMSTSSRVLLRQSRQLASRRYASTNTEKAAEAAKNVQSKASEGLSKVSSSAGSGISKAASGVASTLGKIGGRTGRIIAFVESE